MGLLDDILKNTGLTYEDLDTEGHSGELDQLNLWLEALKNNQLTIDKIRQYITNMRISVEEDLAKVNDVPTSWLSFFSLFLPLVGIVRKWYQDERKLGLTMRLRNYTLLESFLTSPERARAAIEQAILSIKAK